MSSVNFYYEGQRYVANDANHDGVLNLDQEQFLDDHGQRLDRSDTRIDQFKNLAGSERSASQIPLANLQLNAAARLASLDRDQLMEQLSEARRGHGLGNAPLGDSAAGLLREEAQTIIAENRELLLNLRSTDTTVDRALLAFTIARLDRLESSFNISSPQGDSKHSASSVALGIGLLALSVSAFFVAPRLIPLGFLTLASAAFFAGCGPSSENNSNRSAEQVLAPHSQAITGLACENQNSLEGARCYTYSVNNPEETYSAPIIYCDREPASQNETHDFNETQLASIREYCGQLSSRYLNSPGQSFVCFGSNSGYAPLRLRAEATCSEYPNP